MQAEIQLKITNTGERIWKRDVTLSPGSVAVGFKLCNLGGEVIDEHAGRTAIPCDTQPGASFDISVFYPLSRTTSVDQSIIRIDMILQGYFWFADKGTKQVILLAVREEDGWRIQESSN